MSPIQISFAAHAQRVGANKCPRCGELVSFDGNNDPYCPYAGCHWNNEENDCPPPPASANGSVRSLAAPAEPGVGVDTPHSYLWRQAFFTEPVGQWLCLGGHGCRFSIARTIAAVSARVQRRRGS